MEMKINRSGKIKYVPKQAYNKFNILFTTFLALFSSMKFGSLHVINSCSNVILIVE